MSKIELHPDGTDCTYCRECETRFDPQDQDELEAYVGCECPICNMPDLEFNYL